MSLGSFFPLLKRALVRAFDDNCFAIAKGAAFSSMLSFFPGLMVVASLLFSRDAEATLREISSLLGAVLPPEAYRLTAQYLTAEGMETRGLLAAAWAVAVWSASDAVVALMAGFRAAYRLPETRSFLKTRAVAMALLLLAGAPLLFATLLLFFGQQIERWLIVHLGAVSGWIVLAGRLSRWAGALLASTAVIALAYHVAPDRRQRWRYVWPGAAVATGLWLPATALFAWYAQNVARYSDLYGSISAAVVLLLWMYLVNLIVLIGCEFNAEYEAESERRTPGHRRQAADRG
jgi:membrane protein